MFLSLGWVIVVLNLAVDTYVFFRHMYQPKMNYRKQKSKVQYISNDTYMKLQDKFDKNYENQIESVSFIEMSKYSRDMMKITPILRSVIFMAPIENMSFKKQIFCLQEYSKIKNTLDSGSIKIGNQKMIFNMIWHFVMKELRVNSKIRRILDFDKEASKYKNNKVIANGHILDQNRDYLRQILTLSMGETYDSINKVGFESEILQGFKEMLEKIINNKPEIQNNNSLNKSLSDKNRKRRMTLMKPDVLW